jgi:hypothetical protein
MNHNNKELMITLPNFKGGAMNYHKIQRNKSVHQKLTYSFDHGSLTESNRPIIDFSPEDKKWFKRHLTRSDFNYLVG